MKNENPTFCPFQQYQSLPHFVPRNAGARRIVRLFEHVQVPSRDLLFTHQVTSTRPEQLCINGPRIDLNISLELNVRRVLRK